MKRMPRIGFILGCSAALAACESFDSAPVPVDAAVDVVLDTGAPRDAGADTSADASDGGDAGVPHLVFLSSKLLYGDMAYKTQAGKDLSGVPGADAACQDEARFQGLEGTYVAWLSTDAQNAIDHIGGHTGPWVLARRTPTVVVAIGRGDLGSTLLEPINSVASGAVPTDDLSTFTATAAGGKKSGNACNDFTLKEGLISSTVGDPTARDKWTANQFFAACNVARRVYCFQR
jgi:hypothetical protein